MVPGFRPLHLQQFCGMRKDACHNNFYFRNSNGGLVSKHMGRLGYKLWLEITVRREEITCVCHKEPIYANILNTTRKAEKLIIFLMETSFCRYCYLEL